MFTDCGKSSLRNLEIIYIFGLVVMCAFKKHVQLCGNYITHQNRTTIQFCFVYMYIHTYVLFVDVIFYILFDTIKHENCNSFLHIISLGSDLYQYAEIH